MQSKRQSIELMDWPHLAGRALNCLATLEYLHESYTKSILLIGLSFCWTVTSRLDEALRVLNRHISLSTSRSSPKKETKMIGRT
ncbi:hypothetical protein RRG08_062197 [Elysia crispata]|uniref:Uncharacterized protein n=1 Tax=Elysia crispata TaxID=231223 RepID=A0AAE1CUW2_9GAST|nr:hypothetical protein RRG08_062197 [Elysia crispata]